MQFSGSLSPDEFWARMREIHSQMRDSFARRASFGLSDWDGSRMLGEWSLGDGTFRSLEYARADASPTVMVATADGDVEDALGHVLMNLPFDDSVAAPRLMSADRTPARASAQVSIPVSGQLVNFGVRTVARYTIADAAVGSYQIVIRAQGTELEGLRVDQIDDIEPYLAGRADMIRKMRAEYGILDPP